MDAEEVRIELAGGLSGTVESRSRVILRCARGVARWWVIEYYEREKGTIALAFRRYCNATRGLKQIAVWLGVAEYDGIWRHQNRAGTSNGVAGIATIQGRIDGSNRQEHGRRNHINSAE